MNQVKFSKKTLLAVGIASAILSGCGGGGGDDAAPSASTTFSMTAIDGYLVGAEIWADQNGDGVCEVDTGEITTAGGQADISNDFRDVALCVKAIEGITVDEDRGIIEKGYQLKAPAGSDVITPITNLVVTAALEKKAANNSLSLTDAVTEAKREVIEALTETTDINGDSVFDETELFGDYIKSANKKLTVIGEVLADTEANDAISNDIATKLDIAKKVTEVIADKADSVLEGAAPVIEIVDGVVVPPELNFPPQLKDTNASVSIELEKGDGFRDVLLGAYFEVDDEGDVVTYSLLPLNDLAKAAEEAKSYSFSNGDITGFDTSKKGTFKFQAFATDEHGARSKPLPVTITINFEDNLPTVVDAEVAVLQDLLNDLESNETIRQGETFVSQEFSILDLFEDDAKSTVTYRVNGDIPGVALSINDSDQLVISTEGAEGKAGKAGTYSFSVEASDESNAGWASAKFTLVILDSPEPVAHPLEGQTFYKLEASVDMDNQRVLCQSLKFEDGTFWFSVEHPVDSLTQCPELTEEVGTYTTDGETISFTTGEGTGTFSIASTDDSPLIEGESTRYVISLVDTTDTNAQPSTQILYTDKADAERHLDAAGNYADYSYYYPTDTGYSKGLVSVELTKSPSSESDAFDADLYFDTFEAGWTCEDALQNFGTFALYERDIDTGSNTQVATSRECYDINDSNGPDEEGLVIIDFDFSQALTEGKRYSVVAIHSDNNDIASFGASFIYQDTSVTTCSVNDTAWDDTTDSPETLTTDFVNLGLEPCYVGGGDFALSDLFTDGVSTVTLRRIDLNPNETEFSEFHEDGTMSLSLDDADLDTTWTKNNTYGYIEYSIEDNGFSVREALAITDYDETNNQIAVKGFMQMTDWDELGFGTKEAGYGRIFSGVYEVTFN